MDKTRERITVNPLAIVALELELPARDVGVVAHGAHGGRSSVRGRELMSKGPLERRDQQRRHE